MSNVTAVTPIDSSYICPEGAPAVPCSLFEDSPQHATYLQVIQDIRVAVSAFSSIGSLLVIVIIILLKKYHLMTSRLIMYLSISAFVSSIVYMMGRFTPDFSNPGSDDENVCSVLGYLLLVADWLVLMWFTIISLNLVLNVVLLKRTEKLEKFYIPVAILFPMVFSLFGFIPNGGRISFGLAGAWCWIRDYNVMNRTTSSFFCCHYMGGDILRFVLWYCPQILLMLFLLISNAFIVYKYWRKSKSWQGTYNPEIEREKKLMLEDVKPIIVYPIVYVLTQAFPLINRIVNWANPGSPVFALYVLHVLTSPLAGVGVAVCYVIFDKENLSRLKWSNLKSTLTQWKVNDDAKEYTVDQKIYRGAEGTGKERGFTDRDPLLKNE